MYKHECVCDRCGYKTDLTVVTKVVDGESFNTYKLPENWQQLSPYFSYKVLCDKCSRDLHFKVQSLTSDFLRNYNKEE